MRKLYWISTSTLVKCIGADGSCYVPGLGQFRESCAIILMRMLKDVRAFFEYERNEDRPSRGKDKDDENEDIDAEDEIDHDETAHNKVDERQEENGVDVESEHDHDDEND